MATIPTSLDPKDIPLHIEVRRNGFSTTVILGGIDISRHLIGIHLEAGVDSITRATLILSTVATVDGVIGSDGFTIRHRTEEEMDAYVQERHAAITRSCRVNDDLRPSIGESVEYTGRDGRHEERPGTPTP